MDEPLAPINPKLPLYVTEMTSTRIGGMACCPTCFAPFGGDHDCPATRRSEGGN